MTASPPPIPLPPTQKSPLATRNSTTTILAAIFFPIWLCIAIYDWQKPTPIYPEQTSPLISTVTFSELQLSQSAKDHNLPNTLQHALEITPLKSSLEESTEYLKLYKKSINIIDEDSDDSLATLYLLQGKNSQARDLVSNRNDIFASSIISLSNNTPLDKYEIEALQDTIQDYPSYQEPKIWLNLNDSIQTPDSKTNSIPTSNRKFYTRIASSSIGHLALLITIILLLKIAKTSPPFTHLMRFHTAPQESSSS